MIAGHPHTVRSSSVPLYMQGFPRLGDLGQDGIDTTMFDPALDIVDSTPPFLSPQIDVPFFSPPPLPVDPSMYDPAGSLVNTVPAVNSNTQDIANMYAGAVASGAMTPAEAAAKTAAAVASAAKGITPFIFPKQPALGPGASPRVGTRPPAQAGASWFQQESLFKGFPNWGVIAAGVLTFGFLIPPRGSRR